MCEKINDRLNGSGCTDITAYEAMKAVRREERRNLIAELKALANRHGYRIVSMNHSQVSRHKKAQFFRGSGYLVCSQYKASASLGVSILSVPCGLFVL